MSNFTYSDELYHHGVLGQKWGVRRYQNKDGTYTAEGKKRRSDSSPSSIIADTWSPGSGKKYSRRAADLGLKALNKLGYGDQIDLDNITDSDRSWFVYEDQTIGMAEVADLVNKGYSSKQVKKAIEYGAREYENSAYNLDNKLPPAYGSFYLNEDNLYPFADACEEVKNSAKHSEAYNCSPELYHHGILGQKWGVRRYQNEDGTLTEAGKKHYRITSYTREGGVMPKGTKLYRIGYEKGDPTALNRKYFSTSKYDNDRWKAEFYPQGYRKNLTYETNKELYIASNQQLGKAWIESSFMTDPANAGMLTKDLLYIKNGSYPTKLYADRYNQTEYLGSLATNLIASQTETGKKFVEELIGKGYNGVGDINGIDIGNDPIILFDPDSKVTLKSEKNVTRRDYNKVKNMKRYRNYVIAR